MTPAQSLNIMLLIASISFSCHHSAYTHVELFHVRTHIKHLFLCNSRSFISAISDYDQQIILSKSFPNDSPVCTFNHRGPIYIYMTSTSQPQCIYIQLYILPILLNLLNQLNIGQKFLQTQYSSYCETAY